MGPHHAKHNERIITRQPATEPRREEKNGTKDLPRQRAPSGCRARSGSHPHGCQGPILDHALAGSRPGGSEQQSGRAGCNNGNRHKQSINQSTKQSINQRSNQRTSLICKELELRTRDKTRTPSTYPCGLAKVDHPQAGLARVVIDEQQRGPNQLVPLRRV